MTTPELKPEHFRVTADRDGDMRLECGADKCYWDRAIRHWDPDDAIKDDDLGSLLEAARAHIAEAHRVIVDGEVTP